MARKKITPEEWLDKNNLDQHKWVMDWMFKNGFNLTPSYVHNILSKQYPSTTGTPPPLPTNYTAVVLGYLKKVENSKSFEVIRRDWSSHKYYKNLKDPKSTISISLKTKGKLEKLANGRPINQVLEKLIDIELDDETWSRQQKRLEIEEFKKELEEKYFTKQNAIAKSFYEGRLGQELTRMQEEYTGLAIKTCYILQDLAIQQVRNKHGCTAYEPLDTSQKSEAREIYLQLKEDKLDQTLADINIPMAIFDSELSKDAAIQESEVTDPKRTRQ